MKLITLNVWGGKHFDPLAEFVARQAASTDIFCFQEVFDTTSEHTTNRGWRVNLFSEFKKILPDHAGFFAPAQDGQDLSGPVDFAISYGLAMFIRRSIDVREINDSFIFLERNKLEPGIEFPIFPRNMLRAELAFHGKEFAVLNAHGLMVIHDTSDTPERIEQSQKMRVVLDGVRTSKILVGDFNLGRNTKSLAMLEEGLRNVTKETVERTRPSFYKGSNFSPDNVIVSPDLSVTNIDVPQLEISDHFPIIVDFSLP